MLKILINAYACCPDMGSEPGMAWNWCVNLARYCELYIITEGEFKDKIEGKLKVLPQAKNMHFYYNPVSEKVRRMCWNQGDWRFYRYYRQWQWKTYEMAKGIIAKVPIDIVHQLNMIGFREPGYLWKIADIPFVWGPIGGMKQFPLAYLQGTTLKMRAFQRLKNVVNVLQIKYSVRVNRALHRADVLVSSIPDSYNAILKYKHLKSVIIPETGCEWNNSVASHICKDGKSLTLIWVGKFDFRKQLVLAIRTLSELNHKENIKLWICGIGNEQQVADYKALAEQLNVQDHIIWFGNLSHQAAMEIMSQADLFFFTSVSEDTSTVVLEAISHNLPVLCFDACGFGYVVNEEVGIKVPLSNPRQSVKDFAEKIEYLYAHRDVLTQLSQNCRQRQTELSWENKAKQMVKLYHSCLRSNMYK